MSHAVQLVSGAWHGDAPLRLDFPDSWDVVECGPPGQSPLTTTEIADRIQEPVGTPTIAELAAGRTSAAILVDDLSRPTPVASLLPPVLSELRRGGIPEANVMVVIAGGTHRPDTLEDMARKVGTELARRVKVVAHDCRNDLVELERSPSGIPVWVNRFVMAADLKIGIGAIYPHPAAGFSGGAKILAPAACGLETIRRLHDDLRPAWRRGGELHTELRREIEAIAERAGLDIVINAVLNQERRVAELFVGHPVRAHRRGVQHVEARCRAAPMPEADVVVADMYPFDLNLQFAYDRGLWPVLGRRPNVSKVVIAACPRGVGGHALYPVTNTLTTRLARRMRNLHPGVLRDLPLRLQVARDLAAQNRLELLILSAGLQVSALQGVFPRARLFPAWGALRQELQRRHGGNAKVAVYRCAPLALPEAGAVQPRRSTSATDPEPAYGGGLG
jgi:nickel-dependent lactate racemase